MPQYHLDYIGELWDEESLGTPEIIESFRRKPTPAP
jgi:hypothetical protein